MATSWPRTRLSRVSEPNGALARLRPGKRAAGDGVGRGADRPPADAGQQGAVEDVRDIMWQLEKDGEIVVHRIGESTSRSPRARSTAGTKRIPTNQLWHHKSCGQCGNIPGYPTSLLWLMNKLDTRYLDETDQTSCTAWNYHGSGIGNVVSLAAVFLRNFHQAYVSAQGAGSAGGLLLSAGPLRHLVRQLQGDAQLPAAFAEAARTGEDDPRQARPAGRRQAADPGGGRPLLRMAARHARAHHRAPRARLQRGPSDHPSGLPRLQDGAGRRDLRRDGAGRQPRRGLDRADANAGRAGDRLLDLVRLLRVRLPPHHRRARIHPLLRHRPQDQGRGRGSARPTS